LTIKPNHRKWDNKQKERKRVGEEEDEEEEGGFNSMFCTPEPKYI
jgi:hypothetical protein